jgi:hypothetical protein
MNGSKIICDEGDDVRNEDTDVLEEDEQNDDDFVLILTVGWEIGEDYWDSADEDDEPDYDPHEHIERWLIVKNRSEKHHLVRDFSDISESYPWYKCVNWFDERRNRSMILVNGGKIWSTKVTEKLNKRAKKSRPHRIDPYDSDRGGYEIIHHGETCT